MDRDERERETAEVTVQVEHPGRWGAAGERLVRDEQAPEHRRGEQRPRDEPGRTRDVPPRLRIQVHRSAALRSSAVVAAGWWRVVWSPGVTSAAVSGRPPGQGTSSARDAATGAEGVRGRCRRGGAVGRRRRGAGREARARGAVARGLRRRRRGRRAGRWRGGRGRRRRRPSWWGSSRHRPPPVAVAARRRRRGRARGQDRDDHERRARAETRREPAAGGGGAGSTGHQSSPPHSASRARFCASVRPSSLPRQLTGRVVVVVVDGAAGPVVGAVVGAVDGGWAGGRRGGCRRPREAGAPGSARCRGCRRCRGRQCAARSRPSAVQCRRRAGRRRRPTGRRRRGRRPVGRGGRGRRPRRRRDGLHRGDGADACGSSARVDARATVPVASVAATARVAVSAMRFGMTGLAGQ